MSLVGLGRDRRIVRTGLNAIPAQILRPVQGDVGQLNQLTLEGRTPTRGFNRSDTDRYRYLTPTRTHWVLAHHRAYALGTSAHLLERSPGQDDQEFFTAVPSHQVIAA